MKKQKFPYKQLNQSKHEKTLMSQLRNRTLCNLNIEYDKEYFQNKFNKFAE